jgi:hypothetical protein
MPGVAGMSDDQSKVMNTLLRMIVPIRREFGVSLDVKHFLHDLDYRSEIIAKALASQDTRLREYAHYVQQLLGSPRTAAEPPAPPTRVGAEEARSSIIESVLPASTQGPSTLAEPKSREDELREQIMRKYTTGLR